MTADDWNAEEYRQQRKGCGRSPIVLVVLSFVVLIRKGLKR